MQRKSSSLYPHSTGRKTKAALFLSLDTAVQPLGLQIQQKKKAEREIGATFLLRTCCILLRHLCNGKAIIAESTFCICCCFLEELCFSDTEGPQANAKFKSVWGTSLQFSITSVFSITSDAFLRITFFQWNMYPAAFWIKAWLEHLPAPRYRVNSQLHSHSCVQQLTAVRLGEAGRECCLLLCLYAPALKQDVRGQGENSHKWANQPYSGWRSCWWQKTGMEALWASFSGEQLHKAFLSLMCLWTEWPFYRKNELLHLIIDILKC